MVRFRSSFFSVFGLLSVAVLYMLPASAIERMPSYDTVAMSAAFDALDYLIEPAIAERHDVMAQSVPVIGEETPAEALGPIYLLSMQTDGQSLVRFHMRC